MNVTKMSSEDRKKLREESKAVAEKKIKVFCRENPKFSSYVKNCPSMYRKQYVEALVGEAGKAQALKMKCMECSGWTKEEVENCVVKSCPLYHARPYQKKGNGE